MNDWWDHVELASTKKDGVNGHININLPPMTIDGQPVLGLNVNDRVLLKHQNAKSDNGTYFWNGATFEKVVDDVPAPRATVRVDDGDSAKMTYSLVDTSLTRPLLRG